MKLLMVTMAMNIGGAETHILELCRELVSLGHDVTLASNGGVYADEAVSFGVRHVELPLHTKKPSAVLSSYKGLEKLITEGNFDIVHAHARIPAFIVGLLHNRLTFDGGRKFRFVTSAHLNFSTNALLRRISRWGERTMAVSDDISDYLVDEYGYSRDRIHLTINGIDTEKFSPMTDFSGVLAKHKLDKNHRRIVYMSRLDSDRADPAFRLVNIAPTLAEKYPDTDLVLVGGGNELERIRALAAEANRKIGREYIIVTGAVSNTNEYCAAADVFVGVSRSLLEAMAAGKPVIVAGNQGSLGIFDESKTEAGILTNFCCRGYPVADEEMLLSDISALLDSDPDALDKMGEYNRNFILEKYTARRMTEDYLRMYERTLLSPVEFDMRKGAPDITLSGYYGFGNLGDESLLDIITRKVAETIPGVKLAVLTKSPREDRERTGLASVSRFNVLSVFRTLSRSKILISGGGSLLQDTTSRRSLGYYAGVMQMAKKAGAKVCVLANGIGPVNYESNKQLTKEVISDSDYVSVRDGDSKDELVSLGVARDKINVTADPAFLIEPCSAARLAKVLDSCGVKGEYFAVSVRPLKGGSHFKHQMTEDDKRLTEEIVAVCRDIAEKHALTPLLIPMQEAQDSEICQTICASLTESGIKSAVYCPENAAEMIGVLGGAKFALGMRLHSIIFASSAGVPVIGLSYDPKVKSMMRCLGQTYMVDLTRGELNFAKDVTKYADEVISHSEEIAKELSVRAAEMREKCKSDLLAIKQLLEGIENK
ncbi:MAG: polysaccharide pyruvyl transferase CsaB [Clostridia bacterium]|nr:polysaccharide pyruvyl transferase CsaB [Clostridia bacterium]